MVGVTMIGSPSLEQLPRQLARFIEDEVRILADKEGPMEMRRHGQQKVELSELNKERVKELMSMQTHRISFSIGTLDAKH